MKRQKQTAYELGKSGEEVAIAYLKKKKYKIVKRGFRLFRGEIDVIAYDRTILVFIEVKTRRNPVFGSPEESVTSAKQKQIKKTAQGYLTFNDLQDIECRFDVLSLTFDESQGYSVSHFKDAF